MNDDEARETALRLTETFFSRLARMAVLCERGATWTEDLVRSDAALSGWAGLPSTMRHMAARMKRIVHSEHLLFAEAATSTRPPNNILQAMKATVVDLERECEGLQVLAPELADFAEPTRDFAGRLRRLCSDMIAVIRRAEASL